MIQKSQIPEARAFPVAYEETLRSYDYAQQATSRKKCCPHPSRLYSTPEQRSGREGVEGMVMFLYCHGSQPKYKCLQGPERYSTNGLWWHLLVLSSASRRAMDFSLTLLVQIIIWFLPHLVPTC